MGKCVQMSVCLVGKQCVPVFQNIHHDEGTCQKAQASAQVV